MKVLDYLWRKLVLLATVIVGVTTFLFVISRMSGDPAVLMSPPEATQDVIDATRERLGLDAPLIVQYFDSIKGAFTFDFGISFVSKVDSGTLAMDRLVPSLSIVVPSILLAALLAACIGTYTALNQANKRGRGIMAAAFILDGIPYFILALLLVLIFAITLGWLPATGSKGAISLVIPIAVLTVQGFSTMTRLTRGQLIDALGQGPVTMAKSKGLSSRTVLVKHAVPLAIPPLVAFLGILFSLMMGSLLILEPLLNYAGLGQLLVRSVSSRDFPTVQACVFVMAVLITIVNIAMDAVVRILDPRLRTKVSA